MKNPALSQFVFSLIALVVVLAAYVFWYGETKRMNEEAGAILGQIAAKSVEQSRASETKDALAALSADEAQIAAHFVPASEVVPFLENIETAGSEFGADVAVVSVSDPADGRVSLSLSIIGTFDAVMKTVGRIEYGPYASATKSLTLDSADDGLWSAALSFSVMTQP